MTSPERRFTWALLHGACLGLGGWVALSSLHQVLQSLAGNPTERELLRAEGPLLSVTPCSSGRRPSFTYTFAAPSGSVTDSMRCPSETRDRLAAVIGKPMTVRYQYSRSFLFFQEVDVYALRAGSDVFWSYDETAWRRNSNRELVVFLQLMQAACGLGVMWPAIKWFRARSKIPQHANSA